MLTATDYLMAWSIYLLAACALLLVGWRITRRLWAWLRDALRVAAAVLMLTPASVDGTPEHLAPALFVAVYELLSAPEGGVGPLVGVRLLLILLFAVMAAWVLRLLWYWLVASRRAPEPAAAPPARPGASGGRPGARLS